MALAACGGGGGDGGNGNGSAAPAPAPAFLYFKAEDSVSGAELWKTDGTESGTGMGKGHQCGCGSVSGSVARPHVETATRREFKVLI